MTVWVLLGLLLNLAIVIGAWMIEVRPRYDQANRPGRSHQRDDSSSSDGSGA
jgi:hypothetical protein